MKRVFTAIALIFSVNVYSNIIHVPADYQDIQTAINASSNGDTILVNAGHYFANLNFRGKNIVLTSHFYEANDTSFISSTIIDGSQPANPDTASCIILNSHEDSTTVIQGFTITGGNGTKWFDIHGAGTFREGGAIITEFSSPVIRFNLIRDNVVMDATGVTSTGGGGIRSGDGNPTIMNNVICNNEGRYGGGIVLNYCQATIENNFIVNNSGGQSYGGGGVWATGTDNNTIIHLINNTIIDNHVTGTGTYGGKGGSIFVFSVLVQSINNIIWGNTQSVGNSEAVFIGGLITNSYCDIENVTSGNLNVDPIVDSVTGYLSPSSPCIDAGDSSLQFNDLNVSGQAIFPSLLTMRNDIGAFGGPHASVLPICDQLVNFINSIEIENSFSIMPNPASDKIVIRSKDLRKQISIFDIDGNEKFHKEIISDSAEVDVSNFKEGTYTIRVNNHTAKFQVVH